METLPVADNWMPEVDCWLLADRSVAPPTADGAAPYLDRHQTETVVHRPAWRDDGRSQPQTFARGLAFEPLESAAQLGALDGGMTASASPW